MKPSPASLAFLAVLAIAFAGFAGAQPDCIESNLLAVDAPTSQTVEQGVTASYPITVKNVGSDVQTVALSAECNSASTGLACSFDSYFPTLAPRETLGSSTSIPGAPVLYNPVHLYVDTSKANPGNYTLAIRVSGGTIPGSCVTLRLFGLVVKPKPPSAVITLKVAASLTPENATARPGEVAEWIILLENNRADEAYVALSATDNPFSNTISFDAIEVKLAPGEQRAIRAKATLPAGTPGGMYNWLFLARVTTFDGVDYVEMPAFLRIVGPTIAVQLVGKPLPGECLEAKQGEKKELKMNVKNSGEAKVTLLFYVEAGKETKKMILINPTLLELLPGETSSVTISVTPPSTAVVDTYRYVFVAENNGFQLLRRPYCYSLKGLEEIFVAAPKRVEVLRTIQKEFSILVKNTGTTRDNYSLEFVPLTSVETTLEPSSFALLPLDSQAVEITLKTTMATGLREEPLSLTLRSKNANISKAIAINISIVSSNQTNASLLAVDVENFTVVAGVPLTTEVTVRNLDVATMKSVSLLVNGIPSTWWSSSPAKQDIPAKGSTAFKLTFNATTKGTYDVVLAAVAGPEGVEVPSTLHVEPATPAIDAKVFATQQIVEGGVVKGVVVDFSVTNTGNTPLTNVEPKEVTYTDNFLFSNVFKTSLAPGETKIISAVLRPLVATTSAQNIPVQAVALEAASTPQTIALPAMAREKYAVGVSLPTIAAVVVLIAFLAALVFLAWRAKQAEYF